MIISQGRRKRKLADVPYAICGSREELELLRDRIRERLETENFCGGWVEIRPYPPIIHCPQGEPEPWDESFG